VKTSAAHPSVFAASHTPTYLFADGGVADAFHDGKLPASAYRSRKLSLYRDGELVGETTGGSSYYGLASPAAGGSIERTVIGAIPVT
jgi:hypothetical protein